MSTKIKHHLKVGDRVAERPRLRGIFAVRKESVAVAEFHSQPRFGVVKELVAKPNARGQAIKYCMVLWDYQQTPSLHAHSRLCLESEWEQLTENARETIGT
jgi:hypothetical protein